MSGNRDRMVSPEEFAELMALLNEPPAEQQLSPEARWRADYRAAQARLRIASVQEDLFGGSAVTHYRRHAPQVQFDRPPIEGIEEKTKRIAGYPFATFGPDRPERPSQLSREERDAIVSAAVNWLRVGQRVRLVDGPSTIDPAFGNYRHIGREGVIFRLCGQVFADRVYMFLDPVGGERTEKVILVELRDLVPLSD